MAKDNMRNSLKLLWHQVTHFGHRKMFWRAGGRKWIACADCKFMDCSVTGNAKRTYADVFNTRGGSDG
jgi:hypothetical protein